MSLRTRLLLAFGVVLAIPLIVLAFGLRYEVTRRLTAEYDTRLDLLAGVISGGLAREKAALADRLASLADALADDNRFRAAAAGAAAERPYLLDYAGTAMPLAGLSMLQVVDEDGRILSSGHFRNEHGREVARLPSALASVDGPALLESRTAAGGFIALAAVHPVRIGGRTITLIGGRRLDDEFLRRLAPDPSVTFAIEHDGQALASVRRETGVARAGAAARSTRTIAIPFFTTGPDEGIEASEVTLVVTQPRTELAALLERVDTWFLLTAAGAGGIALLLAFWISARISRPLADLAIKASVIDLNRLDIPFDGGTDEVGTLSRALGEMADRLRTGTARMRDAERRATVGDLARQINHDIKNGLIPLRNVMRHLGQVAREEPASLPGILAERQGTIDSSLGYLETLATNYQRLSPAPDRRRCDVHGLIGEVVRGVQGSDVDVRMALSGDVPPIVADPVAIRRVLENLVTNAIESIGPRPGQVTISTGLVNREDDEPAIRLVVADDGRGMSQEEMARIFNHFYSTKPGGTGLGLSIVRRLVTDLHGSIRVESSPGSGTRVIVQIPVRAATTRATEGTVRGSRRHAGERA